MSVQCFICSYGDHFEGGARRKARVVYRGGSPVSLTYSSSPQHPSQASTAAFLSVRKSCASSWRCCRPSRRCPQVVVQPLRQYVCVGLSGRLYHLSYAFLYYDWWFGTVLSADALIGEAFGAGVRWMVRLLLATVAEDKAGTVGSEGVTRRSSIVQETWKSMTENLPKGGKWARVSNRETQTAMRHVADMA